MVRRNFVKGLALLILISACGCTSKWVMDAHMTATRLQWPNPPNNPKVKQIFTITGFREEGTSVNTIFSGKGDSRISQPVAVTRGHDGRLAIADTGCRCVHLYVPAGSEYHELSEAGNKEIVSPVSVVFDDELRLYVSDSTRGEILVFDKQGNYLSSLNGLDGARTVRPTGLAFSNDDKILYAVDTASHKIDAYEKQGKFSFSFGARGYENGQFNFPTHIFWSSPGRLYVTDAMNFRIQIFDDTGSFIAAVGHHGDGSGDFAMPKGIAADKDGIIFVADSLFDNIQLFSMKGDFLLTVGGRGTGPGEFWLPSGIFIDDDMLFVCDTFNRRVQAFQIFGDYNGR
jgi:DNA-binding beta-propeller fold protein YncE